MKIAEAKGEATSEMRFSVHVERLTGSQIGRSAVVLDPLLMEQYQLVTGDYVELGVNEGRTVLARLISPDPGDKGRGIIRLDRYLRQTLRSRLSTSVDIRRVHVAPVRQLFLQPPLDLLGDDRLSDRLRDELSRERVAVSEGVSLYLPINEAGTGAVFRVNRVDAGPGYVDQSSRVFLTEPNPDEEEAQLDVSLDDVGGLDHEICAIRELVELPLKWPAIYRQLGIQVARGIILYGPPGTGKTHLCRALAHELDARFYYLNGPEVVGTMQGETEATLRGIFGEASRHAPSIICIDELDAIARSRRDLGSQSDIRAVTQLLSLMSGLRKIDGVVVLGTTNQLETIDSAFRRTGRFDREIYIGPPDTAGRLQILRIHSREMRLDAEANRFLPALAERTHGFVGADLVDLCREAGLASLRRVAFAGGMAYRQAAAGMAAATVSAEDLEHARTCVRPSAGRNTLVAASVASRVEIAGLDTQLNWLRRIAAERCAADAPGAYRSVGGVLLYGPTGCGKSLLAQAIAAEFKYTFLVIHGPEIFSKWLGGTEEAVRHIFDIAERLTPSLILFDQLEAIAPTRGADTGSRTTDRVVGQLLTELDGLAVRERLLVIGETNRPDLVDPSVIRAGRLGIHIHIPLPGPAERRAQFQLFARQLAIRLEMTDIDWLVQRTEGFPGSDIRQLISLLQFQTGGAELSTGDVRRALEEALAKAQGEGMHPDHASETAIL